LLAGTLDGADSIALLPLRFPLDTAVPIIARVDSKAEAEAFFVPFLPTVGFLAGGGRVMGAVLGITQPVLVFI